MSAQPNFHAEKAKLNKEKSKMVRHTAASKDPVAHGEKKKVKIEQPLLFEYGKKLLTFSIVSKALQIARRHPIPAAITGGAIAILFGKQLLTTKHKN